MPRQPLIGFVVLQIVTIRKKRLKIACIVGFTAISLIYTGNWVTNQAWKPVEEFKQVAQLGQSKWHKNDLVLFYPDYIKDTIKHYFSTLPSENIVEIPTKTDIKQIESGIRKSKATLDRVNPSVIFLIVRVDLIVEKDLENYQNMLTFLESQFRQQLNIQVFLILSHDLYFVKDFQTPDKLLLLLKSKFGEPLLYHNFRNYILYSYQKKI